MLKASVITNPELPCDSLLKSSSPPQSLCWLGKNLWKNARAKCRGLLTRSLRRKSQRRSLSRPCRLLLRGCGTQTGVPCWTRRRQNRQLCIRRRPRPPAHGCLIPIIDHRLTHRRRNVRNRRCVEFRYSETASSCWPMTSPVNRSIATCSQ